MVEHICTHCHLSKDAKFFYKNKKKSNGLDSQCKACILKRKSSKYKKSASIKRKNSALRSIKKTRVLDVEKCTFKTTRLNTVFLEQKKILTEELVRGILCHLKK